MDQVQETHLLTDILEQLHEHERTANTKARKNKQNQYQWGVADGLMLAKQILIAALYKAEKENAQTLAQ